MNGTRLLRGNRLLHGTHLLHGTRLLYGTRLLHGTRLLYGTHLLHGTRLLIGRAAYLPPDRVACAGILEQSTEARNRVEIEFSYQPARLQGLAKLIPWNRCLGYLKFRGHFKTTFYPLVIMECRLCL